MKEICPNHTEHKRKYCEACLHELNAEQQVAIEQLYSRLDAMSVGSTLFDAEQAYPVATTVILNVVPFALNANKVTAEVLASLLAEWNRTRATSPDCLIGASPRGFFIYRYAKH